MNVSRRKNNSIGKKETAQSETRIFQLQQQRDSCLVDNSGQHYKGKKRSTETSIAPVRRIPVVEIPLKSSEFTNHYDKSDCEKLIKRTELMYNCLKQHPKYTPTSLPKNSDIRELYLELLLKLRDIYGADVYEFNDEDKYIKIMRVWDELDEIYGFPVDAYKKFKGDLRKIVAYITVCLIRIAPHEVDMLIDYILSCDMDSALENLALAKKNSDKEEVKNCEEYVKFLDNMIESIQTTDIEFLKVLEISEGIDSDYLEKYQPRSELGKQLKSIATSLDNLSQKEFVFQKLLCESDDESFWTVPFTIVHTTSKMLKRTTDYLIDLANTNVQSGSGLPLVGDIEYLRYNDENDNRIVEEFEENNEFYYEQFTNAVNDWVDIFNELVVSKPKTQEENGNI